MNMMSNACTSVCAFYAFIQRIPLGFLRSDGVESSASEMGISDLKRELRRV